ncbi:M24 family metallopeptidase [Terriglobus roseus]|uniref:Xaa-Pro aminopeptidase n=1 Tax=Terriglobus roseus TaxID=392734 RepID=A0A1G7HXD3_9BACT|nr:Xaa-Pro peptidase family protein [Terriglobus roseus]SDF05132.1 Xaa-Pro aminopeptidase [Terriglobus roseus]
MRQGNTWHRILLKMMHRGRIRHLAQELRRRSIPSLLVTNLPDVRYLTGFTGSNAALVVVAEPRVSARLFTDGRYTVQAKREVQGATVRIAPKSALAEACDWAEQHAARCGFDRSQTTVAALASMKKSLGKRSFFVPADGLIAALRMVKDAIEVDYMRRAASLTCSLYEGLLGWIEPGMRERDIAAELEHRARLSGAEAMSFETIVASGERSSQPHARATQAHISAGNLVTLDFGIVLDGYCSDMTRTFAVGYGEKPVPPKAKVRWAEQREVFGAVLAAQQAGVNAVRAGATCGEVDRAARSVLEAAGYGKYFTHSTGHGVGLEIHEVPRVGKDSKDVLKAGTVITIEPGVYLPGRFGVRIEDSVLVTEDGAEVLTPAHKGWMEL